MSVTPLQGIKSIQRVVIPIGFNASSAVGTIAAVNPAKTSLRHLGQESSESQPGGCQVRLSLTNATTVTAERWAVANLQAVEVSAEVIEWF